MCGAAEGGGGGGEHSCGDFLEVGGGAGSGKGALCITSIIISITLVCLTSKCTTASSVKLP